MKMGWRFIIHRDLRGGGQAEPLSSSVFWAPGGSLFLFFWKAPSNLIGFPALFGGPPAHKGGPKKAPSQTQSRKATERPGGYAMNNTFFFFL